MMSPDAGLRLFRLLFVALAFATPSAGSQAGSQAILDVTEDGAWCWFADPRAIVVGDHLLSGWVSSKGDIVVSDRVPGEEAAVNVLHAALDKDDHANPALLGLPDGRVMAFYTRHTGHEMLLRETLRPGQFDEWTPERSLELNDPAYQGPSGDRTTYTYPNPVYLADEGTIALTWRGMNWKPTVSFSRDLGATWTTGRVLLSEEAGRASNRPYVKVATDGRGRMHFIATDGHPRNEPTNSVYHFYYERGAFYRMDGTQIATIDTLPVRPKDCDVVYDGKAEGIRAWVWDLALDEEGAPVAVYTRLPQEDSHEYRYARWNGRRWLDHKIVEAGGWFPETPEGETEPEPHYSGGVVLDHDAPSSVYLSRPINGTFQIERWTTRDGGDSWSSRRLTDTAENSVRPVVARGRWSGGAVVLWMDNRKYVHYLDFDSKIRSLVVSDTPD